MRCIFERHIFYSSIVRNPSYHRGKTNLFKEKSEIEPDRIQKCIFLTLCIGWILKVKHAKELCLVSDSCLSCGDWFYVALKIYTLKR